MLRRPIILFLALLAVASPTAAEPNREQMIKVAVAYNIARFSAWPPEVSDATDSFQFCLIETDDMAEAFQSLVGRSVGDKPISIRIISDDDASYQGCRLAYFSDDAADAALIIDLVEHNILTISDREGFAAEKGIVEISLSGRKPTFSINTRAAARAGITPSSKVLELASEVIQ